MTAADSVSRARQEPARPASRRPPGRLMVVLPALNEQESVSRVVADVQAALPDAAVLVVDDGSTDATAARAAAAGALVMRLPFNLGVGGAMRAAYRTPARTR